MATMSLEQHTPWGQLLSRKMMMMMMMPDLAGLLKLAAYPRSALVYLVQRLPQVSYGLFSFLKLLGHARRFRPHYFTPIWQILFGESS